VWTPAHPGLRLPVTARSGSRRPGTLVWTSDVSRPASSPEFPNRLRHPLHPGDLCGFVSQGERANERASTEQRSNMRRETLIALNKCARIQEQPKHLPASLSRLSIRPRRFSRPSMYFALSMGNESKTTLACAFRPVRLGVGGEFTLSAGFASSRPG
jgi:hypothetical protein